MKNSILIYMLAAGGLILSGCNSAGPETRENAALGAGVGAVAGGVAGAQSGDTLEGAAIGAAVGGAAGGAYGNYRDRQNERDAQNAASARELPITDYDRDGIVDTQDDFVDVDNDGVNDKAQLEQEGYVYDGE